MSRYTDIDIFLQKIEERYCKDCEKRKGMKNGKRQFVYEIGEVPCRACDVDDMKFDIDNAPTVDAVEVVRCKDCKYRPKKDGYFNDFCPCATTGDPYIDWIPEDDWYCASGEKVEQ